MAVYQVVNFLAHSFLIKNAPGNRGVAVNVLACDLKNGQLIFPEGQLAGHPEEGFPDHPEAVAHPVHPVEDRLDPCALPAS